MISNNNIVDIKGLIKRYDSTVVLDSVDLEIKENATVTLVGRSGCGKSTLLRCIAFLEIFESGAIQIAGERVDISQTNNFFKSPTKKQKAESLTDSSIKKEYRIIANKIRRNVGLVFQAFNLFPHLSVLENITLPQIVVKNTEKSAAKTKAIELLEKVDMHRYLDRMPHQISGGQAQRVAIARSLAMDPKILLYDEPTSSLDPELIFDFFEIVRKLKSEGLTQIIVTHSLGLSEKVSDSIIYMDSGKVIEHSPTDTIFTAPKDPRTRDYLNILRQI